MTLLADVNCSRYRGDLVSNWEPARSLVEVAVSGVEFAPCLPASGGAWAGPQLASSPWYLLNPCSEQAWLCFRLDLFTGKLSLSLFSLSLAIPQFVLLCHVSSLRLFSGHSGLVLTLSNATCASLFSPCLLVADMSVWATSLV